MPDFKTLKALGSDISILYAEDDTPVRESFSRTLQRIFQDVRVVANGEEGLRSFAERPADVVITDIKMPRLDGLAMLEEMLKINPTQNFIITSGYSDSDYFIRSIEMSANSYLLKPIDNEKFITTLTKVVQKIKNERELKFYQEHLEDLVREKSHLLFQAQEQKIENYEQTLVALVNMVEKRDSYTGGHSQRVAQYSRLIAEAMGYDEATCDMLYKAGILHDIGKVAIPDAILLKPDRLNKIEYRLIKEHVVIGHDMLSKISMFHDIARIIYSHHERHDGSGYPQGIKGDAIPELSRIMIVADAFDAMTTSRIYKSRKSVPEALQDIRLNSGHQFHPNVVDTAIDVLQDIEVVQDAGQVPKDDLEFERFVYFYNDNLTQLHNEDYLNLVLFKNSLSHSYHALCLVSLHHFNRYNDRFGWKEGDKFLKTFAKWLMHQYPDSLIFRLHANDFVLLNHAFVKIDPFEFFSDQLMHQSSVTVSVHALDLDEVSIANTSALEAWKHQQVRNENKRLPLKEQ